MSPAQVTQPDRRLHEPHPGETSAETQVDVTRVGGFLEVFVPAAQVDEVGGHSCEAPAVEVRHRLAVWTGNRPDEGPGQTLSASRARQQQRCNGEQCRHPRP